MSVVYQKLHLASAISWSSMTFINTKVSHKAELATAANVQKCAADKDFPCFIYNTLGIYCSYRKELSVNLTSALRIWWVNIVLNQLLLTINFCHSFIVESLLERSMYPQVCTSVRAYCVLLLCCRFVIRSIFSLKTENAVGTLQALK